MNKLNISGFPDGYSAVAMKELKDADIFVSESGIRIFGADGAELDPARYGWLENVIKQHNGEGHYSGVSLDGDTGDTPPKPGDPSMARLASDIWQKRNPGISDADAVANLRDVYSHRRTAMTA